MNYVKLVAILKKQGLQPQ